MEKSSSRRLVPGKLYKAAYTGAVAPGLRIGRGLELLRFTGRKSWAEGCAGLRIGRGLEHLALVVEDADSLLRPVSGSGEDWNRVRTIFASCRVRLRPVSGSGEDWNTSASVASSLAPSLRPVSGSGEDWNRLGLRCTRTGSVAPGLRIGRGLEHPVYGRSLVKPYSCARSPIGRGLELPAAGASFLR